MMTIFISLKNDRKSAEKRKLSCCGQNESETIASGVNILSCYKRDENDTARSLLFSYHSRAKSNLLTL